MKSTAVILLCSLLFTFACQLSHTIHADHHVHYPSTEHHAKHLGKDVEQESFLDISSLVPSGDTIITGVESVSTDIHSAASVVTSVASFILSAINLAFVPVNIILQIAVVACGAPFLVGVVPYVTWALGIMSLSLFFVPFETVLGYVKTFVQIVYNLIRPFMVKYIPYFETIESFVYTIYSTAGAVSKATSDASKAISSGASKGFNATYSAADKIGQSAEAVVKKAVKLATAAVDVAKDVPTFLKEVTKKIFAATSYSKEQIDAMKDNMVTEFQSRSGTSTLPPSPPSRSYPVIPPAMITNTTPVSPDIPPIQLNEAIVPLEPFGIKKERRPIPSRNNRKNKVPSQNLPESEYLDMRMAPSLTPKAY